MTIQYMAQIVNGEVPWWFDGFVFGMILIVTAALIAWEFFNINEPARDPYEL
jgi:hypothetical protein